MRKHRNCQPQRKQEVVQAVVYGGAGALHEGKASSGSLGCSRMEASSPTSIPRRRLGEGQRLPQRRALDKGAALFDSKFSACIANRKNNGIFLGNKVFFLISESIKLKPE